MKIVCYRCNARLAERPPFSENRVTLILCEACLNEILRLHSSDQQQPDKELPSGETSALEKGAPVDSMKEKPGESELTQGRRISVKEIAEMGLALQAFGSEQPGRSLYKIEREEAVRTRLYFSDSRDELTGLHNRTYFFWKLEQEIQRCKRQGHPLSIIILDVNGFGKFNRQNGCLQGDDLLRSVAKLVQASVRAHVDSVFRYGGDEFAAILPEADGKVALSIGGRIKAKFNGEAPEGLMLGMGAAVFQKHFDIETFVGLATRRLHAKAAIAEGPKPSQPRTDAGKSNSHIRCLSCGNLIHWTSSICENCLSDPAKDPRGTPRISFRKTFMHDGLIATVQNVSEGGVQIRTKKSLSTGEVIRIALSLGDGMVRFCGIVVYVQSLSNGDLLAGIKLAGLSDKDSGLLSRFLETQSLRKRMLNE